MSKLRDGGVALSILGVKGHSMKDGALVWEHDFTIH